MQISVEEPQRRTWDRRDEYRDDVAPPATAWSDKLRGDTIPEGCNRRSARSRGSSVQQHLSTSSAPRFKIKDFHSHKIDKASSDPLLPIKARLAAGSLSCMARASRTRGSLMIPVPHGRNFKTSKWTVTNPRVTSC